MLEVFVTGGTGFIGEHLIRYLIDKGYIVHALYRSEEKKLLVNLKQVHWHKGDITDFDVLVESMRGCKQLYHVAAYAVAWEEHKGDFHKYNVQGTINVLNAAIVNNVQKVVFTSTAGIFGPSIHEVITENNISSLPHFTGYESSKAEAEQIVMQYVYDKKLPVVIVNPTRVFGPGILNQSNSVTLMIKKYIEGNWHILPGNGNAIGNYAFVKDVVEGHYLAMQYGKPGERYLLGGENLSYKQFFSKLAKLSGKKQFLIKMPLGIMLFIAYIIVAIHKINKKFLPPFTPAHVRKFNYNWEVSCKKAIKVLNYKITPFEIALKHTIDALVNKKL